MQAYPKVILLVRIGAGAGEIAGLKIRSGSSTIINLFIRGRNHILMGHVGRLRDYILKIIFLIFR
jgi:hypothetical protein